MVVKEADCNPEALGTMTWTPKEQIDMTQKQFQMRKRKSPVPQGAGL
jgi:hypothetical protein